MKNRLDNTCQMVKTGLLLLVALLLVAPPVWANPKQTMVKTMTRNLYLGADIFKVVEAAQADPDSVPYAVAEVYQTMLYTNFWERAQAIAEYRKALELNPRNEEARKNLEQLIELANKAGIYSL